MDPNIPANESEPIGKQQDGPHQVITPAPTGKLIGKRLVLFMSSCFLSLILAITVGYLYVSVNTAFQHFKNAVTSNEADVVSQVVDKPGVLPTSPFYTSKRIAENLYQGFLTNPTDKYIFTLYQANERITEVNALLQSNIDQTRSLSQLLLPKALAQSVDFNKPMQLSFDDMDKSGKVYISRVKQMSLSVDKMLRTAREERDVVKILCLHDKLTQIAVANNALSERQKSFETAVTHKDQELADHQYRIIIVLYSRVQQVYAESRQCIGQEAAFIGSTQVTTSIEATQGSGETTPVDLRAIPQATPSGGHGIPWISVPANKQVTEQNFVDLPVQPASPSGDHGIPWASLPSSTVTAINSSLLDYQNLQTKLQAETPTITDTNLITTAVLLTETQPFIFGDDPDINSQKNITSAISGSIDAGEGSIKQDIQTINTSDKNTAAILALNNIQNQQGYILLLLPNTPKNVQTDLINRIREYNNMLQNQTAIVGQITNQEAVAQQIKVQLLESTIQFPLSIMNSGTISPANQTIADLILQTSNANEITLHDLSNFQKDALPAATLAEKHLAALELETLIVTQASPSAKILALIVGNLSKTDDSVQTLVSSAGSSGASVSEKTALVKNYHVLHGYSNNLSNYYSNVYNNSYSNTYNNTYSNVYSNMYSNIYSNLYSNDNSNLNPSPTPSLSGNPNSGGTNSSGSSNASGYNAGGYNSTGYNGSGYNSAGYNASGYNSAGSNASGYNSQSSNTSSNGNPNSSSSYTPPATPVYHPPASTTPPQPPATSAPNPASACSTHCGTWDGSTCQNPKC